MKNILVGLGVVAVVAVVGAAAYERMNKPSIPPAPAVTNAASGASSSASAPASSQAALQIRPTDMVMGNPDAKVTIIEYASLTCPHCAAFHANTLPALKERYLDTGKAKLAFRDFPLDGLALRAAMVSHCAGNERYYGMLGTLFARQIQWRDVPDPLLALAGIARQAGMNEETFKACIADKAVEKTVLDSALEADKTLGVNSTPTIFINGQKFAGALTIDQMAQVIDPLVGAN